MKIFNKIVCNPKTSLADQVRMEQERIYQKGLSDNLPLAKEKYPLITQEILNSPNASRWKISCKDYGLTRYATQHIVGWLKEEGFSAHCIYSRLGNDYIYIILY